jgi:hypothetical protein
VPKIRGIHPDIWTDEDFVELTPFARLLWLGMWNWACDNGHLADRSKQIKMRVLPTDDVNAAELLRELESNRRITRSDGWITIPNFSKRQRPDRRFWVICAAPGCVKPGDPERETRGGHVETTRAPNVGSRGALGDGEGEGEVMVKVKRETPSRKRSVIEPTERFEEFWSTYSHKVGRKKAEGAYRAALKKPGVTDDLLIASAAAYIEAQRADRKHPQFTKHAATWLTGEHWRDERVASPPARTRFQEHIALVRQLSEQENQTYPQIGPA